jgi:hypothetical protein
MIGKFRFLGGPYWLAQPRVGIWYDRGLDLRNSFHPPVSSLHLCTTFDTAPASIITSKRQWTCVKYFHFFGSEGPGSAMAVAVAVAVHCRTVAVQCQTHIKWNKIPFLSKQDCLIRCTPEWTIIRLVLEPII